MYAVRTPAARFHLIRVQPPEFQLLFEERSTHVSGVVQFSRSVGKKKKKTELDAH